LDAEAEEKVARYDVFLPIVQQVDEPFAMIDLELGTLRDEDCGHLLRDVGKRLQGWEGGIYKKLSSNLINWAEGLFRYLPVLEQALSELDISGIMAVSLENALQHSSIQGSDQAGVGSLTEEIIA
jgi:hypothetical protein